METPNFEKLSIKEFNEILSSKAPVPGGGGASALVGALGISLGNMVGSLTVGKKKYAQVEPEIKELMQSATRLREELLELMNEDALVFEPLSKAYGMPSETEEDKKAKALVMAVVLKEASLVPLKIMRKCCEAIDILEQFASKGSVIALSDAGVGAAFAKSAMQGASLNVFINTKSMVDRELANELNSSAKDMMEKYSKKADAIFKNVFDRLDN